MEKENQQPLSSQVCVVGPFFFLYLRPLFVLPAIFNHLIISSTTSLETAQIGKFLEISNLSYRFHILLIVFLKKNY